MSRKVRDNGKPGYGKEFVMHKKKLLALGIAVVMMFSTGVVSFAESTPEKAAAGAETETEDPADVLWENYNAALQAKNYEEAMGYLWEGAEMDDTRSIMNIGLNYLKGECGLEVDYDMALEYLQKATDAGDGKAPRYIGLMYAEGQGVDVDDAKASEYFQIGTDNGDISSMYYLGRCYEFGKGVEVDYEKAMELYQKAAERGDRTAAVGMLGIASLYEHGRGVEENLDTAKEWYDKAAEAEYSVETLNPKMITAITQVYGNGERINAVAIEFNQEIDKDTITSDTFSVEGRSITNTYFNDEAAVSEEPNENGNILIIELDPNDADVDASVYEGGIVNGGNGPTGTTGTGILKYIYTDVIQVKGILDTNGTAYVPNGVALENHDVISTDIDKFEQRVFEDENTGDSLMYNLYIPEGYSESESYPLVLFLADASANGDDVFLTLRQGNGATVWATEEEQAKHPSFVVAPQFSGPSNNETVIDLLAALQEEFSIDVNRIYTTGQSQGCIASIAMDIEHPGLFAGLLLVAGQNDAEEMRAMENDNIWILVSEGDKKGYPGMNASVEAWEADGTVVSKAVWDATWSEEEFASAVEEMRAEGNNIKYTTFALGTTWDGDPNEEDPNEHNSSMHVAYDIEGVRDWLFEQVLGEAHS